MREGGREGRAQKEEKAWGKISSGWCVCGIVAAGYISCVNFMYMIGLSEEGMNSPEDMVGLRIVVPSIPPALDDTGVVAMHDNTRHCKGEDIESSDEELESNSFHPSSVSLGARVE